MKTCPKCNSEHEKSGTFCSRACANSRVITDQHKQKTSSTLRGKPIVNQFGSFQPKLKYDFLGPYTRVYRCVCKYSNKVFYSKSKLRVHPELARTKDEYRYSCQFRFSVSSFPYWFSDASTLIEQHGWYSTPGSRKGLTNTNGISRDHLYSITDGWVNHVPPSVIRHPANCALIPHKENQSKHKKSKISLEELYAKIAKFEMMAPREGVKPPPLDLETSVLS